MASIKLYNGKEFFQIQITDLTTIRELKNIICSKKQAKTANFEVKYNSVSSSDEVCVNEIELEEDDFLTVDEKSRSCYYNDCKRKPKRLIGSCTYCKHIFCSLHRLQERHLCNMISQMKLDMHAKKGEEIRGKSVEKRKI